MRLKEGNTCVIRIETGSRSHGGTRNIMVYHPLSSSLIGRVREAHRNFCWQSLRISVSSTERPHWSGCLREASVNNWQDDWQQAFYRVTFTSIRRIRPDSDISQNPTDLDAYFGSCSLLSRYDVRGHLCTSAKATKAYCVRSCLRSFARSLRNQNRMSSALLSRALLSSGSAGKLDVFGVTASDQHHGDLSAAYHGLKNQGRLPSYLSAGSLKGTSTVPANTSMDGSPPCSRLWSLASGTGMTTPHSQFLMFRLPIRPLFSTFCPPHADSEMLADPT
jgi:hypothetical protein